jgi:hypothetical protein
MRLPPVPQLISSMSITLDRPLSGAFSCYSITTACLVDSQQLSSPKFSEVDRFIVARYSLFTKWSDAGDDENASGMGDCVT